MARVGFSTLHGREPDGLEEGALGKRGRGSSSPDNRMTPQACVAARRSGQQPPRTCAPPRGAGGPSAPTPLAIRQPTAAGFSPPPTTATSPGHPHQGNSACPDHQGARRYRPDWSGGGTSPGPSVPRARPPRMRRKTGCGLTRQSVTPCRARPWHRHAPRRPGHNPARPRALQGGVPA